MFLYLKPKKSKKKRKCKNKTSKKNGVGNGRTQSIKRSNGRNDSNIKPKNTDSTTVSKNDKNNVRDVINKANEAMKSGSTKANIKQKRSISPPKRSVSPPKRNTSKSDIIKKEETLAVIILVNAVIQRGMEILGVSLPDRM